MLVYIVLLVIWVAVQPMAPVLIGFYCYLIQSMYVTRILRTCSEVPRTSCARRGASSLTRVVKEPFREKTGRYPMIDYNLLKSHGIYADDMDNRLEKFFLLCHRVGFEIVIRPVKGAQGDTELDPDETDKKLKKLHTQYERRRI